MQSSQISQECACRVKEAKAPGRIAGPYFNILQENKLVVDWPGVTLCFGIMFPSE